MPTEAELIASIKAIADTIRAEDREATAQENADSLALKQQLWDVRHPAPPPPPEPVYDHVALRRVAYEDDVPLHAFMEAWFEANEDIPRLEKMAALVKLRQDIKARIPKVEPVGGFLPTVQKTLGAWTRTIRNWFTRK